MYYHPSKIVRDIPAYHSYYGNDREDLKDLIFTHLLYINYQRIDRLTCIFYQVFFIKSDQ